MSTQNDPAKFHTELMRRFDELVQWATDNRPNNNANSAPMPDFSACRKEIISMADALASVRNEKTGEASPSEGGAQYVNMNPTPWP